MAHWNDPNNVEAILQQEERDKKRTGRGIHSRTGKGSDKAGVKGGVQFVKHNFKRYEKNSKTQSLNRYEKILSKKDFDKLPESDKRTLLKEWRRRFKGTEIAKQMGIVSSMLYKLYERYGVETEGGEGMTPEQLEQAKQELISAHEFKQLPPEQKYELAEAYKKLGYNNKQLSEAFNLPSFSSLKSGHWKKKYNEAQKRKEELEPVEEETVAEEEPLEEKSSDAGLFDLDENSDEEVESNREEDIEVVEGNKDDDKQQTVKASKKGLDFELNEDLAGTDLTRYLQSIANLINLNKRYNVKIEIEESGVELDEHTLKILEQLKNHQS